MNPSEPDDAGQDRLLEHDYDGIREYDNPMPRWWLHLFYASIVYAVLYFINVIPGVGSGKGRIASYERTVAEARARAAASAPREVTVTEGVILAAAHDPAKPAAGRETFTTTCVACHLADGGGLIGPNLTDAYWIHGGQPLQIYRTVHDGVPDKGMPAWSQSMPPDKVISVVAFVTTLRGTHPAKPKAPQGTKESDAAIPARP